jgi:hypothetical protein
MARELARASRVSCASYQNHDRLDAACSLTSPKDETSKLVFCNMREHDVRNSNVIGLCFRETGRQARESDLAPINKFSVPPPAQPSRAERFTCRITVS